jgi:DNA-directed RNA polymerase specialized sigma24 family protein
VSEQASNDRLSQISTAWTTFFRAHATPTGEGRDARRRLLELYGVPVYRYLRAAARDPDAADELYQEFALRLVRGDFRAARPDRGRFRDFLKTALYHLVVDHRRRRSRQFAPLPEDDPGVAAGEPGMPASDEAFLAGWREEVLAQAWQALARHERETGQPLHTVLRFRADHPDVRSPQMAEALAPVLGRTVDAGWVRKRLHQARELFADVIVGEMVRTVDPATPEAVADELQELGLLDYCRDALGRMDEARARPR